MSSGVAAVTTLEKPACSTETVYEPTGSWNTWYAPSLLVTVSETTLVPTLVTLTLAPGTTASWASVTVPIMRPFVF